VKATSINFIVPTIHVTKQKPSVVALPVVPGKQGGSCRKITGAQEFEASLDNIGRPQLNNNKKVKKRNWQN
jgi:hypothetical protein